MEVKKMYRVITKLAGVLVNDAQNNIREIQRRGFGDEASEKLTLSREPDNKYDPNAIKVEADGKYVGYIPRGINKGVAEKIDAGCRFIISHFWFNKSPLHDPVGLTVEIMEVL
jgi:hypothetical protein